MRCAFALTVVLASSCASVPVRRVGEHREGDPSWPTTGGRSVRYVGELSTPEQLGIERSGWARFWSWLTGDVEATALAKPFAVAFARDGRLAVADPGTHAVRLYDPPRGTHLRLAARSPLGLAFVGDTLVVADGETRTLRSFDVEGHETPLRWKSPRFGRPTSLAWDEAGQRLFVVDAVEHCVHVLSAGEPTRFGVRGEGPGQFNFPTHATFAAGHLYVTDALNFRVQIFDAALQFERAFGGLGDGPGDLPRPKGLAVDARGVVWVVEGAFDVVQGFDARGELVAIVGEAGTHAGQFWLPAGAAIDPQGRLFVADTWNGRVQVFELGEVTP